MFQVWQDGPHSQKLSPAKGRTGVRTTQEVVQKARRKQLRKEAYKSHACCLGDSTNEEEGSEEEEKEVIALMGRSETDSDEESSDSLIQLKNKVSGLNKTKLKEFLFTLMDECDALHSENCDLKDECCLLYTSPSPRD